MWKYLAVVLIVFTLVAGLLIRQIIRIGREIERIDEEKLKGEDE